MPTADFSAESVPNAGFSAESGTVVRGDEGCGGAGAAAPAAAEELAQELDRPAVG
eukprot:CAMPEP_0119484106 /NCGR_PEP_ID=MMETSP1344-20130328/11222_1 /TAXON_ID=236787 /ORGANISM="Florenciella parvula, Strain CCMP2471" /LENGTH=54 /DNA_ID=CAMNT_0007518649 /DNA_START=219 /DNA_END=379 /DNA_ORIENTATION=+